MVSEDGSTQKRDSQLLLHASILEFDLTKDPMEPLYTAITNSEELKPFVEKVGAPKIAEVILNLLPFAPHDPDDTSEDHLRRARDLGLVLADGTPVTASFDYNAFDFVCVDTLHEELGAGGSQGLYEALKNTNLLGRVYKGPLQKNLLTGKSDESEKTSAFDLVDTGRAVISKDVMQVLTTFYAYQVHHEHMARFDEYLTILNKAMALLPESMMQTSLEENDRGVYLFLRDKHTKRLQFYMLSPSTLRSPMPLKQLRCNVTLTTADSGYTDTADALSNCIEHGYTSAQKGRISVHANAFLGELTSAQKNAEKSQKSGDSYVLIATEVGTVKTMNAVSIPSQTSIAEPQVIRSTNDPIFVDTILPEHMHVLILLPETATADHKSVYTQLFANIAPELQYSFNFT